MQTNSTRWSSTCEKVLRVSVHRKLGTEPRRVYPAPASSDRIVSRRLLVLLGVPGRTGRDRRGLELRGLET